jgi:uncharacterized protein (TIGR03067 family)
MESAMRRVLPLLAAILALAFAPAPFPKRQDAGAADLKTMQGAWVLVCELKNGRREEMTRECVWLIEGDRIRASLDGKEGSTSFIKLDGRSKPRSIDLRTQRDQASHLPGIYVLERDLLNVCLGDPNDLRKLRPRDLSGFGQSRGVWVFKRKKR